MKLWGLSDLHLGPGVGKGHYSSSWQDHQPRMRASMDRLIAPEDYVLMPGDFSWNSEPEDLVYDFHWLEGRPGTKIISPGNHDYGVWDDWDSINDFCRPFPTVKPIKNGAVRFQNPIDPDGCGLICVGVEGSQAPEDHFFNTNAGVSSWYREPESVRFLQEMLALKRSLDAGNRLRKEGDVLVVLFHYPPFAWRNDDKAYQTAWNKLIEGAGVRLCVYGHLHQESQFRAAYQGEHNGCAYRFVGADFLRFQPTLLGEWTPDGVTIGDVEVVAERAWPDPKAKKQTTAAATTAAKAQQNTTATVTATQATTQATATSTLPKGEWKGNCTACGQGVYERDVHGTEGEHIWHERCVHGS